jgi:hypothetical protein
MVGEKGVVCIRATGVDQVSRQSCLSNRPTGIEAKAGLLRDGALYQLIP